MKKGHDLEVGLEEGLRAVTTTGTSGAPAGREAPGTPRSPGWERQGPSASRSETGPRRRAAAPPPSDPIGGPCPAQHADWLPRPAGCPRFPPPLPPGAFERVLSPPAPPLLAVIGCDDCHSSPGRRNGCPTPALRMLGPAGGARTAASGRRCYDRVTSPHATRAGSGATVTSVGAARAGETRVLAGLGESLGPS